MSDVLWRRLSYFLSPQLDIYQNLRPHLKGKDVLEVGFGTGFGVVQYARDARMVVGIEQDKEAAEWAIRNIPLFNVGWTYDSIETFDVPQKFDAVVMFEVLEHIKDYRLALKHVHEHLKENGALYISARNANADLRKNDLHEREWKAGEFASALLEFFSSVQLFDYTISKIQDIQTRSTPLVAVARK